MADVTVTTSCYPVPFLQKRVLEMDPNTRNIKPTEYLGVKLVSFGFAGQGSAIMRGSMVSGVIQQLLVTSQASWSEADRC